MCRIIRNISILLLLICISRISCEDDLPDFDFVDSPIEPQAEESGRLDYIYYDKNYDELEHYFVDDEFNVHINRTKGLDLDDTDFPENDGLNFKEKEQKLRKVIIKALSVGELRRKFSEVMPMLRAMSKSQRITLAALITAQINAKNGNTLTLDQVKQMFGDRPELILPLVLDIANLIRQAAQKQVEEQHKSNVHRYKEQERIPSAQWLRRSFNVNPLGFQKPKEPLLRKSSLPVKTLQMNMQDDRLMVEEMDEPLVELATEQQFPFKIKTVNFSEGKNPEALPLIQTSFKKQRYEEMTYHERKMNMTAFNQTAKHKDQIAMPSDGPIPVSVTLPRADTPELFSFKNLSRDQIEDLAFSELNGTLTVEEILNGTDPNSPMAEMLVSRYRKKHHFKKGFGGDETCERFTGGVCLKVDDYPMDMIMGSIRRHRYAMEALLAEYRDKDAEFDKIDYLGDPDYEPIKRRRQDSSGVDSSSPGSMCSSIIRYARPQKARSATGEWKYIVNTGQHTQTLRLEKCSIPHDSCQYLSDNFRSRCVQIYNYHRLLSWDNNRGLHVDIFKVPTCCSCHIDGYKEAFPPLALHSHNSLSNHKEYSDDFASASSTRNTQYSTLNGSTDYTEDDYVDDNIAYQYGNGFQKIKPPKDNKNRLDKASSPKLPFPIPVFTRPTLETYLSPPVNDFESNFPFKPKLIHSRRRPVVPSSNRKTLDQSISSSEYKFSQATMLPPKLDPKVTDRLRNKIVPPMSSTIDTNSVNIRIPNQAIDLKRINYNYHPIIDFFDEEETKKNALDKKRGKIIQDEDWRPMVQNHELDDPRLLGH